MAPCAVTLRNVGRTLFINDFFHFAVMVLALMVFAQLYVST